MLTDQYQVKTASDFQTSELVGVGPKERITKEVRYCGIDLEGFYNLGFGDKDPITGYLSDTTVTNAGSVTWRG